MMDELLNNGYSNRVIVRIKKEKEEIKEDFKDEEEMKQSAISFNVIAHMVRLMRK